MQTACTCSFHSSHSVCKYAIRMLTLLVVTDIYDYYVGVTHLLPGKYCPPIHNAAAESGHDTWHELNIRRKEFLAMIQELPTRNPVLHHLVYCRPIYCNLTAVILHAQEVPEWTFIRRNFKCRSGEI